jgi:hypothetical protein
MNGRPQGASPTSSGTYLPLSHSTSHSPPPPSFPPLHLTTLLPPFSFPLRSLGASTGPYLAGLLYERPSPYRDYPFYIAGGLKIVYDLALLGKHAACISSLAVSYGYKRTLTVAVRFVVGSFAAVRPPEEAEKHRLKGQDTDKTPLHKAHA